MDILIDKQLKSYPRLSRYSSFPIYYDTEAQRYCQGSVKYLSNETNYTLYQVKEGDTYDSIALEAYNNPTYYWIICSFNRINDCFETPYPGSYLKIPTISTIQFED